MLVYFTVGGVFCGSSNIVVLSNVVEFHRFFQILLTFSHTLTFFQFHGAILKFFNVYTVSFWGRGVLTS